MQLHCIFLRALFRHFEIVLLLISRQLTTISQPLRIALYIYIHRIYQPNTRRVKTRPITILNFLTVFTCLFALFTHRLNDEFTLIIFYNFTNKITTATNRPNRTKPFLKRSSNTFTMGFVITFQMRFGLFVLPYFWRRTLLMTEPNISLVNVNQSRPFLRRLTHRSLQTRWIL